jgi:hypothetical protein
MNSGLMIRSLFLIQNTAQQTESFMSEKEANRST